EMDLATDGASIFAKYVGELTCVLGHADRVQPLRDYCAGLLVAEGRKSVEPMAAATAPAEVSAQHQKLLHFVGNSPWSDERRFATKPQIALGQIRAALKAGVPPGVVLMDASYGCNLALRTEITALGLTYVAAITSTVKVSKAKDPKPPRESVKELALRLPKHAWRTITWREGTNEQLRSRFARVRVHASPTRGRRGQPEETLLIEWPSDAKE